MSFQNAGRNSARASSHRLPPTTSASSTVPGSTSQPFRSAVFPYPEYHTSDDNLDIIHEDLLLDAVDAAEDVIRIYASNYIPRRMFRGPVFFSGHGLWVDWRENWELNRAIEKIMMKFEGRHTVFDIAEQVDLDYWTVREYVEKFRVRGLMHALPIPSEADVN